ncbi:hypothetical protein DFP93_11681 [Aneurinibacillus soli]|uniref:Uncharacterized protein n=1 Tax=Aneurinibacillus soli TaxID=1500254 RepID=A0A0U5BCF1_9BACL|nr:MULTISPECIES: hypothetical protein [Aneurinibacillus]PYE59713.1 hypothetical protein DFP93_11681 [Aneurinibacillus soli]WCN37025.1 hypothetical protein PO771_14350 [Aneurinibacillus sp. B1]BAU29286.1 hypothetical protein CB4_03473 [Aneurinibacillus soli]
MERYLKMLAGRHGHEAHRFVVELIRQITFDASLSPKERTDEIKKIYWALDEHSTVQK